MVRFEISVTIGRPADDVFKYVTDVSQLPDWQSTLSEARWTSGGAPAVGAKLVETRKFLAKRWETVLEVVEYEPGRAFTVKSVSGPMRYAMAHRFENADGRTKLTLLVSGNEPGQRVIQHTNLIGAARKVGVSRIVFASMLNADRTTSLIASGFAQGLRCRRGGSSSERKRKPDLRVRPALRLPQLAQVISEVTGAKGTYRDLSAEEYAPRTLAGRP